MSTYLCFIKRSSPTAGFTTNHKDTRQLLKKKGGEKLLDLRGTFQITKWFKKTQKGHCNRKLVFMWRKIFRKKGIKAKNKKNNCLWKEKAQEGNILWRKKCSNKSNCSICNKKHSMSPFFSLWNSSNLAKPFFR